MDFGVRAHDIGCLSVEKLVERLKEEGVKNAQLAIPRAIDGVDSFDKIDEHLCHEIHDSFKKNNINIAILSCYQDLSCLDEKQRIKAVDTFIKCLKFNKIIGAGVVGTETSYDHLSRFEKHKRFTLMMDSLLRITEVANQENIDFAIEPVSFHPLCDVETTLEVIDELKSSHVKVIFDLANVLERPHEVNQKAYFKRCFELLNDKIAAIHLKDFDVDENGVYIPKKLGAGCMDYSELIRYIESHPNVPVIREELELNHKEEDKKFIMTMFKS